MASLGGGVRTRTLDGGKGPKVRTGRSSITRAVIVAWLAGQATALAAVDLVLQPREPVVRRTAKVRVDVIAFATTAQTEQVGAIDLVLAWPSDALVVGRPAAPAGLWLIEGFPVNADGLNDGVTVSFVDLPNNDGDAVYTALASPVAPIPVTQAGRLLTTLTFEAAAPSDDATVAFIAAFGMFSRTRVLDGVQANRNITGDISSVATIRILPCAGDVDLDGETGLADLGALFGQWGASVPAGSGADLDGNGVIGADDLSVLFADWGCGAE